MIFRRHPDIRDPGRDRRRAGDYSNEGQHPSSSWLPVRTWQVSSSSRGPTSFQTDAGTLHGRLRKPLVAQVAVRAGREEGAVMAINRK